jgi:hypothetical protein
MTTCATCQAEFAKQRMGQRVCSPICASRLVQADKKQAKERAKLDRALDKAKREGMKTVKQLKAVAQDAFNDWIRARDVDQPCISCGETNPPMKPGGQWDAGHFLGRGAFPELAFDEDNCHKQCKSCNGGSGKFAHKARTVAQQYEANLIERIGQDRVDRLKGPHEVLPLKHEHLRQIATIYRAKLRELKKGNA